MADAVLEDAPTRAAPRARSGCTAVRPRRRAHARRRVVALSTTPRGARPSLPGLRRPRCAPDGGGHARVRLLRQPPRVASSRRVRRRCGPRQWRSQQSHRADANASPAAAHAARSAARPGCGWPRARRRRRCSRWTGRSSPSRCPRSGGSSPSSSTTLSWVLTAYFLAYGVDALPGRRARRPVGSRRSGSTGSRCSRPER